MAGGVGLLAFGLQNQDNTYLIAGVAAFAIGLVASFRRIVCPQCRARMWVSSKKLTHCMKCGADWTKPVQIS